MGTQALAYFQDRYRDFRWESLAHRSAKSIRSVYRLVKDGVPAFYVKIYDPVSPAQKLFNRLCPRTLYEARMLESLRRSGIRVPAVAAHLTCKGASALVTEAVYPVRPLWDLNRAAQAAILLEIAVALLQNGFFYTDLHAGNVLLDMEGRPVLIDAYEIKPLARIRPRHIIELMAQVGGVYRLADNDLTAALARLVGQGQIAPLMGRIRQRSAAVHARRVGRWIRRALCEGSFSRQERVGAATALVNRRHAIDVRALMERVAHSDTPELLVGAEHYALHPFPRAGRLSEPHALQAWKGLLTLFFNEVACDEPVAAIVYRDRSSALITTGTQDLSDLGAWLRQVFMGMEYSQKRRCAAALGRTIGDLHARNIRHAELSCASLKVGQDPLRFIFLPSAGVRQRRDLSPAEKNADLARLALSLPIAVTRTLKLAFIKAYADAAGEDLRRAAAQACASPASGRR